MKTPFIKFCGNRSLEDYRLSIESMADFIGFVFYKGSKRYVDSRTVANWVRKVKPKENQQLVGVFVNPSYDDVDDILNTVKLDVIQLHGLESLTWIETFRKRTKSKIWKAIHHGPGSLELMRSYQGVVDGFIIDCKTKTLWGGSGQRFDWSAIPDYKKEAEHQGVPYFIAGGISPMNVEQLLVYQPMGMDVASGIEHDGKKSERFIHEIMRKVVGFMNALPDERGRYGEFGGRFVPETLMYAIQELENSFEEAWGDGAFRDDYHQTLVEYSGRPTPLTHAKRLSAHVGGADLFLKREDLNHTGAHKINNAIGQGLLAKRMGKEKIVAETGAGQHGVATATIAAYLGLSCKVFMGEKDIERQTLNVFRMELLGAEVVPAKTGSRTLKDATNEALRYWAEHVEDTFYLIGSVVGPHPYPKMVREFQRVIGDETKRQFLEVKGCLPDALVACVGGGSNAMGLFYPFIDDRGVLMFGAEAGGKGVTTEEHAATLTKGRKGVIHGSLTYLLQDSSGQITEPYSISAGLDYPGIGPEHAYLADTGRARYEPITDDEALASVRLLCELEGILPALESAHALALAIKKAKVLGKGKSIIVNLSGRGDKDVETLMKLGMAGGEA
jgi:tryptophan synthase beta subunit